ncbi:MAG: rod shape-determining protein MreC, partial [Longimicrobiales bacterium]|nr:rod shape-determining protein MreC [Longimicrobiales bacterium]
MATFHPDPGTNRIRRQGVGALFFFGLALVMYFLPPPQQQEVASLLRASVLRPFIATQELVSRTRVQTREASELQQELDSLVSVLANQTTLAEENRRLRALLGLERRIGVDYRAASLLRPGTEGSESMFLLQVAGDAGVRSGAPVIAPEGLVGVVREVGSEGAMGMDWTHPDFRASAMTADGTTYGIVEPGRDLMNGASLLLTGTPFTTRIEPGTRIVTSGRGGVYPRGIPIGTVVGLAESEGGWRKTYGVEPAVELGAVTHVLVGVGKTVMGPALP